MICENPDGGEAPRCTLMIQDEIGPVASYNNALVQFVSTPDGLVSVAIGRYSKGWVRERPQGIKERDLTARIEAVAAELEQAMASGDWLHTSQALKIAKGNL